MTRSTSIIVSMILTYLNLNSAIQDDTMFLDYAMDGDPKIKRIMFLTQSCAPSVHERTTFHPLQETYFFHYVNVTVLARMWSYHYLSYTDH